MRTLPLSSKKGVDPKNYRPVSLTSLVSKVMEHVVCKELVCHLTDNNIISHLQHGFQQGLSCTTQLISAIHDWASVLNTHGQVDAIFLDFAKAFDSVPYERLLAKAKFYGIRGKALALLRAFLVGRRQCVVMNGSCSGWSPVVSGVPLGTVLGPILFLLFINDLPAGIESNFELFADDISIPADHGILQQDLRALEAWAKRWQLSFVPQKCYAMSITLKRMPLTASYTLCGSVLEGVGLQKYLGVLITCTLSWHKQAEEVKTKATRVLNILQRSISSCSPAVKARAYSCLVRPIVECASVAWSPHTQRDIKAVESVPRRAARFVLNDYTRKTSVAAMLESVGWDSFERRRLIQDMMTFYNINFHGFKISFPADIHTKESSHATRAATKNIHQFFCPINNINAHKYSFLSVLYLSGTRYPRPFSVNVVL